MPKLRNPKDRYVSLTLRVLPHVPEALDSTMLSLGLRNRQEAGRLVVAKGLACLDEESFNLPTSKRVFWAHVDYPISLASISIGVPFRMLNYEDLHIRVQSAKGLMTIEPQRNKNPLSFNEGIHLPIVNLKTGYLFWMAGEKPCRLAEQPTPTETSPTRTVHPTRSSWINEALRRGEVGHSLFAAHDPEAEDGQNYVGFADGSDDSWHLLLRDLAEEVPAENSVRIINWTTADLLKNLAAVKALLRSRGLEWLNETG